MSHAMHPLNNSQTKQPTNNDIRSVEYVFEDDSIMAAPEAIDSDIPCVCPPTPFDWTNDWLKFLIYFFTVEWIARVFLFEPSPRELEQRDLYIKNRRSTIIKSAYFSLFVDHLTDSTQLLDALAIFPFYLEALDNTNGLMSLRLLRLFRVFTLLRLGQYNTTFLSLTNVLMQSVPYLKLLVVVLIFGSALFGSLMYWLEKGKWQYHADSGIYRFVRIGLDGITEEPSPFTSIPAAFWWFMVTATTVGYG